MKKILKLILVLSIVFVSTNCEEDLIIFDPQNGQTAISFAQTSFELSVPQEDYQLMIPVQITTSSSEVRTFNAMVESATEGTSNEYSIGTVTIPADSFSGELVVDFDYSEIAGEDGDVKELQVKLEVPEGGSAYNDIATISYFREIVCNDLDLTIISDVWATETYFTLESADGTVIVDRFFPFSGNSTQPQTYNVQFNLADGDYVFKLGDSYGDGQQGTGGGVTLTGSYSLTCSIITHASGEGTFENEVADPFGSNANATVEVTNFTVNP
jgi:hypothetical protein